MKKDKLSPFFFVGLCLLILGSIILYQHLSFLGDAQKVTGVISNMIGVSDFDESRTDVYVTYEYKEKLYKDILLNEYHAGMNKGKEITLYCNPDHPTTVCTKSGGYFSSIALMLVGCLMSGIQLWLYLKKRSNRSQYAIMEKVELSERHEEELKDFRVPIGLGIFFIIVIGMIRKNDTILGIGVICFILFLFWAIMYHTINYKRMLKRRCTELIMAECIEIQCDRDSEGDTYAPVYQIQYKGETLTLPSMIYTQHCDIKVNQTRAIKIDPQNPHHFIELKRDTLSLPAQVFVIAFLIFWVLVCLLCI